MENYEKKYEKLVDAVKMLRDNNPSDEGIQNWVNDNVPELQESEDEKIRKDIRQCIKLCNFFPSNGTSKNEMYAWLENQCEKKSSDEVLKIRQEAYQSGYNDGYKHDIGTHAVVDEKKNKFNIGDIISNNKAIYRVDNIVKNCIGQDCYFLVNVEREKDGTRYLKLIDSNGKSHNSGEITWLCEQVDAKFEKQVEQKPTDKVEPKFKVGDLIIDIQDGEILHINKVRDYAYYVTNLEGASFDAPRFSIEKYNRLWTIQDAKVGDVLVHNGCTFIFKGIKDGIVQAIEENILEPVSFGEPAKDNDYHPATKEQRDLLFSKMKEAGYEWDAEKKELKKIHVIDEGKAEMDYCFTKMMNGEKVSSGWSVDDYSKVQRICQYLDEAKKYYADITEVRECIDWLKSFRPRNVWKPSEEQMKWFSDIIDYHQFSTKGQKIMQSLYDDLKKLNEE